MTTSTLTKIRESGFSAQILGILIKIHCDSFILRLLHAKDRNASKVFFSQNSDRISAVCKTLADETSRSTYMTAIRFCQSYKRKDAPTYNPEQYFPEDVVKLSGDETFIDCGAFVGDTTSVFLKKSNEKFNKIVCFEPDATNFAMLNASTTNSKVIKIQAGVWNETATLKFKSDNGGGSHICTSEEETVSIPVVAIDTVEACQGATYIKMDIEGAETNALLGARQVIERNRPKLAVCIYHSDEDMLRIPEYLHATLVNYSFHVRHHSLNWQDTVLYAIPNEVATR